MRKWEEKYEKLKNGEFDARIDELKLKVDERKATKEELKEYESLSKSKGNIDKVQNVIEFRKSKELFLEDIKKELQIRDNAKKANEESIKIEVELAQIQQDMENIAKKLKDKNLSPEERTKLENRSTELKSKREENNKKYTENQAALKEGLNRNGKLKDYSDKELEELKLKTGAEISKCNMVANKLVNGFSWDSIDLALDNWDNRKFTSKDEKLKHAVEQARKEKVENFEINIDPDKDDNKPDLTFADKHPRLAKVANFFKGLKDRFIKKENVEKVQPSQPLNNEEVKRSTDSEFKDYIKYVAEYGEKDARKEQLKDNKDLNQKLEQMRAENRKAEEAKYGEEYAKQSDPRTQDDGSR